ncbi:MAG: chemotaxis response regulator protein-glutamate methylesterase [Peptococcaceae bacterium]|nr:chemotaxis response regulator protein-glutamate methylesterase [Peptococcaceae bacterium]
MKKRHKPIRVLIVDDSPFIRMSLTKILSADPEIKVIDVARDGKEGILKLQALKPDVVTMDIEMPVMDGLQALEEIMRWQPTPVIILSAVTTEGARQTMKAFEAGAVEVVAKPSGRNGDGLATLARDLILKVKSVAESNLSLLGKREQVRFQFPTETKPDRPAWAGTIRSTAQIPAKRIEVVAIGVSTGGPSALQTVLSKLPADFPVPVVVAQHMPVGFTASLAARLDSLCATRVKEVENGELLQAGTVYIGQAGKQFQFKKSGGQLIADIGENSPITTFYKPSVDVMLMSLAQEVGAGVLGVIMTGMGNDGLNGMKALKKSGGFSIAESEKTCVVYGMPRAVIEAGLVDRIEALSDISRAIIDCVKRR